MIRMVRPLGNACLGTRPGLEVLCPLPRVTLMNGPSRPRAVEPGLRGAHQQGAGLGACRRNAPTSILGGTKRIGRSEIVDPEPFAQAHFRRSVVKPITP